MPFRTLALHAFFALQMNLSDLNAVPRAFWLCFFACIGAIIGSFLNVVIHRLPLGESIVFPNSRCPQCDSPIRAYDNVPVLAWAWLRGRCRDCRTPISARYPLVEALTGFLFALVFLRDGLAFALPFDFIFVAALVALIFIDAAHKILPDAITLPGIIFALIARFVVPNLYGVESLLFYFPPTVWTVRGGSLAGAFLGAAIGGGSLWFVGWFWERLRKVEAMGFGDVKLMFAVGAYLGWQLTLLTLFLGVTTGALTGVAVMAKRRDYNMQMELPFGIFLGLGAIISLLYGAQIIAWYFGRFAA